MHHSRITKKFLQRTYVVQGLSTWAIEKKYGVSRSTVYAHLKKHGIASRSIAKAHIKYRRKDFSENKTERAYLIGFALGDLRVRNHNGAQSETISIACGSTKKAQIDLIYELFHTYGRVWRGKPNKRGVINVEAFVNKSFSFLLPQDRSYQWCANSRKHFLAFLAGFTDAEGSFFTSNGKAFISWGNYNTEVLCFIRDRLLAHNIDAGNIFCDKLKGYVGSHGFCRNGTYCHLSITKKTVLAQLIKMLEPYLKHKDKLKKVQYVKRNLRTRGVTI